MALAATEILLSLPFSSYVMGLNIKLGIHPWISWADTHYNFNRYEPIPFGFYKLYPTSYILMNITRYSIPVGSIIFFLYLGMSGESGQFYGRQLKRLATLLGFKFSSSEGSPNASWLARSGFSQPSRSLPPNATFASVTSEVIKKDTYSMEYYPEGSKATSSTGSLSLPPGFEEKTEEEHASKAQSAEVPSHVA